VFVNSGQTISRREVVWLQVRRQSEQESIVGVVGFEFNRADDIALVEFVDKRESGQSEFQERSESPPKKVVPFQILGELLGSSDWKRNHAHL